MAITIFTNQLTDTVVSTIAGQPIKANGQTQVDISGTLDGADVITYFKGANDELTPIRTCSWLSSDGDILVGADGAIEDINQRHLVFEVKNAGASTDINLQFDTEVNI